MQMQKISLSDGYGARTPPKSIGEIEIQMAWSAIYPMCKNTKAMDELYIKISYALGIYLNYEINKVINDNEKM